MGIIRHYIWDGKEEVPQNVETVTIMDGVEEIPADTFSNREIMTSIEIPNSVIKIGERAFYYCLSLKSVILPEDVTVLPNHCFSGCRSLEEVKLPDSLKFIGFNAFSCCKNLPRANGKFKATDGKMICKGTLYEMNRWTQPIEKTLLCENGYHFCENLWDIFNYYYGWIGQDFRVFEADTRGESVEPPDYRGDSKRVCSSIKLKREIPRLELVWILNNIGTINNGRTGSNRILY